MVSFASSAGVCVDLLSPCARALCLSLLIRLTETLELMSGLQECQPPWLLGAL